MAITVLRGQTGCALWTPSANPQRDFLLQRFGRTYSALDIVVLPLEIGHRILEQGFDDLYGLLTLIQTLFDGRKAIAELAEFLLEPAAAHTQFTAAIADVVNSHRSFGQQTRMTEPRAEYQT